MALGTIGSENRNLQQLSIHIPPGLSDLSPDWCVEMEEAIEEASPGMQWSDLDRILVQFLESRPIRAAVVYPPDDAEDYWRFRTRPMRAWANYLLPKSIKRGIVNLVVEP